MDHPKTVDEIEDEFEFEEIHGEGETMIEAFAMFQAALTAEDGISKREYQSDEEVRAWIKHKHCFVLRKSPGKQIVAIFSTENSRIVRSEKPIYAAHTTIVKPDYRGKKLSLFIGSRIAPIIRQKFGYIAALTRNSAVAKSVSVAARKKICYLGTVPNSLYFPGYGWTDDLVGISSYDGTDGKDVPINEEDIEMAPMKSDMAMMKFSNNALPHGTEYPPLKFKGKMLHVQQPVPQEAFEVEEMMREAAREGQGFALDEFNPDGFMNRRLLRKSHMLVVKDGLGSVKAGIIFGQSALARDVKTAQVGGYYIVRKDIRGQGLGKSLLTYCLDNIERLGYDAILSDVFSNNHAMLAMLQKKGFIITATVPNSGIMRGIGRTNTYIVYKERLNIKLSKL